MPLFEYKGLDKAGRNVRGTIDADNLRAARTKLKRDNIFVVDIKDKTRAAAAKNKGKKASFQGGGITTRELSLMTRQLSTLLKSNIPLVESLLAVSEQVENPVLRDAVADVKNMVNEGSQFHKALAKYPKIFDKIYLTMCEAGEMSGTLDVILIRLAEFKEAQNELESRVKSALMYPVLMIVFTIVMLGVMFVYVIPQMVQIFDSAEQTLPWYTQLVIGISGVMVDYGLFVFMGGILLVMSFFAWKNSEQGRPQWDAIRLKLPYGGKIFRMVAVSRFTRTLATLLNGGVQVIPALGIVRNVVDNEILARAIDMARDNISEGESIAGPLKKSEQFPPLVIHMISIGEKTGELEKMLVQVSDSYDFQVRNTIDGLTTLLGPIMLIFMGGVIGFIVFSIMVPIFNMSSFANL